MFSSCFIEVCILQVSEDLRKRLTSSPRAVRVSGKLTVTRLSAAFRSLSIRRPHSSQLYSLSESNNTFFLCPHAEHLLDEGNVLGAMTSSDPYHWHLYSSCLLNSYIPTSATARANRRFLSIHDTHKSSITILLWLLARLVVNLWSVS